MTRVMKKCKTGHKMTVENTYHRKQHGHVYKECRECIRLARPKGYTVADQRQLAKIDIVAEDTSQISNCPKCKGVLKWGKDTRYEDAVSCVYCGWRPSAKLAVQP